MDFVKKVESFFAKEGALKKVFPDYRPREGQIQMATRIAEHTLKKKHLIVEAATGVGKSFAYLIPLLLQEKRKGPIMISTGTIALQEQLVEKDLPLLMRCMDKSFIVTLAKGRGHYLCENRFKKVAHMLETIAEDEQDLKTLKKIANKIGKGMPITYSDVPGPLSGAAWSQIASESGVCGHKLCRDSVCSYVFSRQQLKQSDIIVVNHSLLFVHLSLAESGVSLLPAFNWLVLDEAHHCPDIATEQFGLSTSNGQIKFYLDRLYNAKKKNGFLARIKPEPRRLIQMVDELRYTYDHFFSSLQHWKQNDAPENGRLRKPEPFDNELSPKLNDLAELLDNWSSSADRDDEKHEFSTHADKARLFKNEIEVFLKQQLDEAAYWVELTSEHTNFPKVTARAAFVDVSKQLESILFDKNMTVFMTSATLKTSEKDEFYFYKKRMGAEAVDTLQIVSPFDYQNNVGLLTFPSYVSPKDPNFETILPDTIRRLIDLTQGGVFVLVTSFQLLKSLHEHLQAHCREKSYPLLAQGLDGSRTSILNRFRQSTNAVLLGNHSFWEGVDVPGPGLRNVIITKLPFEVPSHPLQESRYELIEGRGGNAFRELALPQAVMRFKQGFGRLVRRADDLGLVCVLDSRVHTQAYGKDFLSALPNCKSYMDSKPEMEFLKRIIPNS